MKRSTSLLLMALLISPLSRSFSVEDPIAKIERFVQKKITDKSAAAYLIDQLTDPISTIKTKERAAWALGELGIKQGIPALLDGAKHKGLLVRSASLDALTRLRTSKALTVIQAIALSDPILSLRQNATLALGLIQSDKAINTLVTLSSDPLPEIRGAAVLSMAALQTKKNDFSEIAKEMEADDSNYVRERAKLSLAIISRKNAVVLNQLNIQDTDIRLFAALYLHEHGTKKELKTIEDAANGEANEDVRFELSNAVKAIKNRIKKANRPKPTPPKKTPAR